ncbi:hypothetical protein SEA_MAGRITTE_71 [Microbacterium phage Magritte]|nr:hypothetical protein SEA_MAGRITTE_71 [Microbacterium phage Magritte]
MTDLDAYDIPFSKVEEQVMGWVTEALELRHGEAGDKDGRLSDADPEDPRDMMNLLRRVRARADRVDGLLAAATRARGRARRAKTEAEFVAANELDKATSKHASRRQEFSSGKEREAEAKLDTFEQRRLAHQAARLVDVTTEAHDVINQIHWQFDAMRKDLRASLHALQFEASLER